MKHGQIVTVKGKIYKLIRPIGKGNWEAEHLASKTVVKIQVNKRSPK